MSPNALATVMVLAAFAAGGLTGRSLSRPPAPTPTVVPFEEVRRSAEADRLRAMVNVESRFERDMHLVAGLDNCEDKGEVHTCTAVTETARTPVAYHCTVDRCELDCSPP